MIQDPTEPPRETSRPAFGHERIDVLDALRGFALLGILLANLAAFSGWMFLAPEQRGALGALGEGRVWDFASHALIDGKFYTVFSLLFGIGFAVQLARLQARDVDFRRLYRRRLYGLLAIGLVHLCLVWSGDILVVYALCGFVLLALRDWSTRKLLRLGVLLIALPIPIYACFLLAGWPSLGTAIDALAEQAWQARVGLPVTYGDEIDQMRRGGADGYFDWVLPGPLYRWAALLDTHRLPKILGIFLIGACAGRAIAAGGIVRDIALLRRVFRWGVLVGLPANLFLDHLGWLPYMEISQKGFLTTILYAIGVAPLGLAYAAGFTLLWNRTPRALALLAPAGKMALTNYLAQSVMGIAVFTGVGAGLAGHLPPVWWLSIGLTFFGMQVLVSSLWLRRFRFGPMEWLWRCATYRRWFRLGR